MWIFFLSQNNSLVAFFNSRSKKSKEPMSFRAVCGVFDIVGTFKLPKFWKREMCAII